jgi:hypothetical protein
MDIKRFKIVSPRDVQSTDNVFEILLLNMSHIISLKPIKMVVEEKVVNGYWIRTSNGKKYRAVEIPKELQMLLDEADELNISTGANNSNLTEAQFLN